MSNNVYGKSKEYQYHPKDGYTKIGEEKPTIVVTKNEVPVIEIIKPKKKLKRSVKYVKEENKSKRFIVL